MSVGVSLNGKCFQDAAAAVTSFSQLFPQVQGGHVVGFVSASASGSVLTYSVESLALDTGALSARSGTVDLPVCELGGSVMAEHGFFMVAAFLVVWALGFNGGLKR